MTENEKIKYYRLCCNHVSIDRPVKTYPIIDDYLFMQSVENNLGVPAGVIGDFRYNVCIKGISFLEIFLTESISVNEVDWMKEGF